MQGVTVQWTVTRGGAPANYICSRKYNFTNKKQKQKKQNKIKIQIPFAILRDK